MKRLGEVGLLVATLGMVMAVWAQASQTVTASITVVEQEYANILLDARPEQLSEIGLAVGTKFTFTHNGQSYAATLVEEYADVEIGHWLGRAFENRVELAINSGNACTLLACKVGDAVTIRSGP